jgi:hypothetical protein
MNLIERLLPEAVETVLTRLLSTLTDYVRYLQHRPESVTECVAFLASLAEAEANTKAVRVLSNPLLDSVIACRDRLLSPCLRGKSVSECRVPHFAI